MELAKRLDLSVSNALKFLSDVSAGRISPKPAHHSSSNGDLAFDARMAASQAILKYDVQKCFALSGFPLMRAAESSTDPSPSQPPAFVICKPLEAE